MSERPTRLSKTEVSAGKSGVGVRYVLIGGMVLIVAAFVILALVLSH